MRKCRVCKVPMVSGRQWRKIPRDQRPAERAAYGGRGLCGTCYSRAWWREHKNAHPRIIRTRQEVLEDYMLIRDEVSSIAQAARRMGMTTSALEKALERARRDGSRDALTPNQLRGNRPNQHFDPTRRSA